MTQAETQNSSSSPTFFSTPRGLLVASVLWAVASMLLAAGAVLIVNQNEFAEESQRILALYVCCIPSILAGLMSIASLLAGSVRWAMLGWKGDSAMASQPSAVTPPAKNTELLNVIAARLLLSETAKKVAYRAEDLSILRQTIDKDIADGEFDAAMVLVQEIASVYGFKEEAESYRDKINASRAAGLEAKVSQAISGFDDMLARHDFEAASAECAKIQRLYPDSERVHVLPRRVAQAREQYKHDLERQFLQAAEKDDIDSAMKLLGEMDKYLTEQEAEPFRETARGVIGKKRDNLGVQFKLAVQDHEWSQALRVGETIIRDFPNSRMADEVRDKMDLLRERAAGQNAATPSTGSS